MSLPRASDPFIHTAALLLSDRVKTLGSQTQAPIFTCKGYCRFEDCPVGVIVEVADKSTLKAAVVFSGGDVCHNTKELQRRPVRAAARQATAELLETKLPRSLYLESMQKITPMVIDSECRDDAPTKNITWTERKKNDFIVMSFQV